MTSLCPPHDGTYILGDGGWLLCQAELLGSLISWSLPPLLADPLLLRLAPYCLLSVWLGFVQSLAKWVVSPHLKQERGPPLLCPPKPLGMSLLLEGPPNS